MRALMASGEFMADELIKAALLNCMYLALGVSLYAVAVHKARELGLLLQSGE